MVLSLRLPIYIFAGFVAVIVTIVVLAMNSTRLDYYLNKTSILNDLKTLPKGDRAIEVYKLQYRLIVPDKSDILEVMGTPDLVQKRIRKSEPKTTELLYWHTRSDKDDHYFVGIEIFPNSSIYNCGMAASKSAYPSWKDYVAQEQGKQLVF